MMNLICPPVHRVGAVRLECVQYFQVLVLQIPISCADKCVKHTLKHLIMHFSPLIVEQRFASLMVSLVAQVASPG
jgi:hypothetical protein